jgi:hypothetical protein
MPWVYSRPPVINNKTLKAQKLDRRADKALRDGKPHQAGRLRDKADKIARKGGWF